MVKPHKVFILLFTILTILVGVSLLTPSEGFRVGTYTFRIPSVLQLFELDTTKRLQEFALDPELIMLDQMLDSIALKSESNIVEDNDTATDSIVLFPADTLSADTIPERESIKPTDAKKTIDVLKSRLTQIETKDSNLEPLEHFFSALAQGHASSRQVRVMHYGDSQIEGDRITSFLRSRFQARFGGQGVGLLHAVPHSYQPATVNQTISNNWRQVHLADLGRGAVGNRFGVLGGYSSFTSTRRASRGGFTEAWIRVQRTGSRSRPARNFTQFRLFYGNATEPFLVSLSYAGSTQDADMVPPTSTIKQIRWNVPVSANTVQIDFRGDEGPHVYGISLESPTGIVVDNIPIRGSSGVDFTRADDHSLRTAFGMFDPRLIILQFGVNVVPHIVESYTYYENQMYQQIIALQRACPNASIILIGVSDMSRREGGRYISYPNIEKIRDAQRNAAFRANVAFWDCYQAMGGANSMPAWVNASPRLASPDYVHFTLRGSNLIAEMFYSSLMHAYESYINNETN